jgi:hypothetical protein
LLSLPKRFCAQGTFGRKRFCAQGTFCQNKFCAHGTFLFENICIYQEKSVSLQQILKMLYERISF